MAEATVGVESRRCGFGNIAEQFPPFPWISQGVLGHANGRSKEKQNEERAGEEKKTRDNRSQCRVSSHLYITKRCVFHKSR